MMKERFSPKDLCEITGVSLRTLHYYHEKGLLLPCHIGENGYRYYNVKDITKLQHILFLRELNLPLRQIKIYFDGDSHFRNKILQDNFYHVVNKRNHLNHIIELLEHHFNQQENEDIEVITMQNFNLNQQYNQKAAIKYGDTKYYQSYHKEQERMTESERKNNFEHISKKLNTFFEQMNELYKDGVSVQEASPKIKELEDILKSQVPNCDHKFLSYMSLTYKEDDRFAKNINKNRKDGLNQYIADAIEDYIIK